MNVDEYKASVSLKEAFWEALKEIAALKRVTLSTLVERIDRDRRQRGHRNLSSALRLFVLGRYRDGGVTPLQ
ncbi:ribbon-helix-helix domain-containing protein [Tardiphaga robiniae]|nr:ribbon-helix-helix domain-containing protein [Tardiphaga robiniae]